MGDNPEKPPKIENLDDLADLAAIAEPLPPLAEPRDDPNTAVTAVYPTSPGRRTEQRAETQDTLDARDEHDTEVDGLPIAAERAPAGARVFHDETAVAELKVPGARVDASALETVDAMGIEDRAKLFSAIAESERFHQRLSEESARAARGLTTFSILLINLRLQQGDTDLGEVDLVLSRALRNYDVCCRITKDELGLILPGASASATTAAAGRLQQLLAELDIDAAIGGASWSPGTGVEELIRQARARLGKGHIARDKSSGTPRGERPDALLWVDGFPHGLPVRASARQGRLQLQLSLPFLRSGVPVYLSTRGSCRAATLKAATIDGDGGPMLHLELAP